MSAAILILIFVTAQRAAELALSAANTRRLLAAGAHEAGRGHYPVVVLLHASWLASLWYLAPGQPVSAAWFAAFLVLQGLRLWVIATLGRRWTTRIIVMPGETLISGGPYAFARHPNYMVVAAEIFVLPACFGLWHLAWIFGAANALVLLWRIRIEDGALQAVRSAGRASGTD